MDNLATMPRPVDELHRITVDARHVPYDWSQNYEDWSFWEGGLCEECDRPFVTNWAGEDRHNSLDNETDCTGCLYTDGPMMNGYWPLDGYDGDEWEDARKLVDLPVCLVKVNGTGYVDDEYGLALTGGGMDLSWEICQAYILLGYLPPSALCASLPDMGGSTLDTAHRMVLDAAEASADFELAVAQTMKRNVEITRRRLEERTAEAQQ